MRPIPESTFKTLVVYTVTIVAGGSFLCWNFFVKPIFVKLKSVKTETAAIGQKKTAVENISALKRRFESYEKSLSPVQQLPWLIEESNRIASESHLTLVSAAPAGDQISEDYKKITLRIEARGGYHELGDFVSRIENLPRFIKISDLHARSTATEEDAKKGLYISLSLSIFCRKS